MTEPETPTCVDRTAAPAGAVEGDAERRLRRGLGVWLFLCVVALVLEMLGVIDELSVPVPLIAALVVARVADRMPRARRWLGVGVRIVVIAAPVLAGIVASGWPVVPLVPSAVAASIVLVGAAGTSILLVSASARRGLLRPFHLDPDSVVHVVAVIAAIVMLVGSVALFVDLQAGAGERVRFSPSDSIVSIAGDALLAMAGVGFLVTRGVRATLERLGLRPLPLRQLLPAAAFAMLLLGTVDVLERAENRWLPQVDAREDRYDYEFIGMSPVVGAVLLSLAAGIGEELVFRGALQPRFGVIATSVLFAAAHVQYQLPGIFMIFVVGLGLGVARARTSTSFTIAVHVLYDLGAMLVP